MITAAAIARWAACSGLSNNRIHTHTVPKALALVQQKAICGFFNRSMRILEAYRDGLQYGWEEFKDRVYKAHCRIGDKSKW